MVLICRQELCSFADLNLWSQESLIDFDGDIIGFFYLFCVISHHHNFSE